MATLLLGAVSKTKYEILNLLGFSTDNDYMNKYVIIYTKEREEIRWIIYCRIQTYFDLFELVRESSVKTTLKIFSINDHKYRDGNRIFNGKKKVNFYVFTKKNKWVGNTKTN